MVTSCLELIILYSRLLCQIVSSVHEWYMLSVVYFFVWCRSVFICVTILVSIAEAFGAIISVVTVCDDLVYWLYTDNYLYLNKILLLIFVGIW